MNRIIKFRAWDEKLKRWEHWSLPEDAGYIAGRFNKKNATKKGRRFFSNTLCQFTGFFDKNGKEIYEGDIVFCTVSDRANNPEGGVREIYWGKDFSFCFREFDYDFGLPLSWMGYETIEIIGNIYENPELLTKKHE